MSLTPLVQILISVERWRQSQQYDNLSQSHCQGPVLHQQEKKCSFCLFNNASSVTKTTQRRMKGREVNDEMEMILKEAVMA
jgi:acetoin utilization deacetylase AcuC-like enzyme